MDEVTLRRFAERFRVFDERYRTLKEGRLPWWKVLWLALRPSRSRFSSPRRLRKAMKADLAAARQRLQRA